VGHREVLDRSRRCRCPSCESTRSVRTFAPAASKTLEADKRKQERRIAESQKFLKMWQREGLTRNLALAISNQDHITVYYTKEKYPASTY